MNGRLANRVARFGREGAYPGTATGMELIWAPCAHAAAAAGLGHSRGQLRRVRPWWGRYLAEIVYGERWISPIV